MESELTTCLCSHCRGSIEFPYEYAGQVVECPHCHQQTQLVTVAQRIPQPVPPALKAAPRKDPYSLLLLAKIVVVLVLLFCGVMGFGWLFGPDAGQYLFVAFILAFGSLLYFLPSIVGRNKRNASAIVLLNVFLGWTFLGWVVALVWAATKDPNER